MRVFRATYEFRQGNVPDNFRTQTSTGIKYDALGIPERIYGVHRIQIELTQKEQNGKDT
jgi:hypothetical protein